MKYKCSKFLKKNITQANLNHIDAIVDIAGSYSLSNNKALNKTDLGFLISDYYKDEYINFLSYCDHFYVYVEHYEVLGFLLGYSGKFIKNNEWLNMKIKEKYQKKLIIEKQLCVKKSAKGKGVATELLKYLFSRSKGIAIFGAIVIDPINKRSIDLHERLGYNKYIQLTPPDNIRRGVWMRSF